MCGAPDHLQFMPSIGLSVPIKEGMIEKRGHSAKYLLFSRYTYMHVMTSLCASTELLAHVLITWVVVQSDTVCVP